MPFKDIKGQDMAIQRIRQFISDGRLAGAYLFIGPEGIGKSLTARALAKALNCLKNNDDSCDSCISCLKIDKNEHPDIHIIDAEYSEIKIEYIRQLQKEINYRPYEGKKKVFIINNAHNLNIEASNAFLKTLEEPPKNSIIILVTDKPGLLAKTILSRCQIIKFSSLKRSELQGLLSREYGLDEKSVHFLAYFSDGSIGKAIRLKDADIFTQKNKIIDQMAVLNKAFADEPMAQGRDSMRYNLNILAAWFRDIYLIKVGLPHSELINLDRKDKLIESMGRYTFEDLDRILKFISDSLLYIDQNVNIRLLLSNLRMELWKN